VSKRLITFGIMLIGLAALVAALAPRFAPYTPKDALIEHGYRETYLEPVHEDTPSVVDSYNRCMESGQLVCDIERNAQGNLEVIGYPTTTTTQAPYEPPAPTGKAASAPARPTADLTVSTTSTTVPTYSDRVVIPPTTDVDCTAHGDPFQEACQP